MMTQRECFGRICMFQKADYIPNYEMGVFSETVAMWRREGLPEGVSLDQFFHLQGMETFWGITYEPIPGVPNQTHWQGEPRPDGSRFSRGPWGDETIQYGDDSHAAGAYELVKPAITCRADWERIRGMFDPGEPTRYNDHWESGNWSQMLAKWKNREHPIVLLAPSMVGRLKEHLGFENFAMMLYDDLPLIEEIMETLTQLAIDLLDRALREVDWDVIHFWEDIAYRNGPILSPEIFEKIAVPRYKRLTDFFRSYGHKVISVDSDGDIRKLIPGWIRGGINNIWPMEPFAGMDVVAVRKEYGQAFSMRGGFNKYELSKGKDAIKRELDRIAPVVADGGYIPHCDHVVGNTHFEDYCYYQELKRQLCGFPV